MLSYQSPVEMAFYYFKGSNYLVLVLRFCFYLTLPATICITMFTLFTIFESFEFFKNSLGVEHSEQEVKNKNKESKKSFEYRNSFGLSMRTENTYERLPNLSSKDFRKTNSFYTKSPTNLNKNSDKNGIDNISKFENKTEQDKLNEKRDLIFKWKENKTMKIKKWFIKLRRSKLLKIILMRLMFGTLLFFPFMLNINEYFLILLTGSLISPCLGFIFPIIAFNYCFKKELKTNRKVYVFNWCVLIAGVVLNLASFIYTVQHGT
jgi:hypothetical protein